MLNLMGYWSLIMTFGTPLAVIMILIWIYKIKRNSDNQLEQNKRIIQLLEKQTDTYEK